MELIDKGAIFSNDGTHRYSLWRVWDKTLPLVMFIGLNPSTANQSDDDKTIESVRRISEHNGYGGFYMMNCWSYISTDPKLLLISTFTNQLNNERLIEISKKCKDIVFAWGDFKVVIKQGRDKELMSMFPDAKAIGINKSGSPKHPLYQKKESVLINFLPF